MAQSTKLIPFLLSFEGGWCYDTGGWTMKGVTLKVYQQYFGKNKTKEDLRRISDKEWQTIFDKYWTGCGADRLNDEWVAFMLADFYYNAGSNATRIFQKILGVAQDGVIGSKTIAAANTWSKGQVNLFLRIKAEREDYYISLATKNPAKYGGYLSGWLRRANSLQYGSFIYNDYKIVNYL